MSIGNTETLCPLDLYVLTDQGKRDVRNEKRTTSSESIYPWGLFKVYSLMPISSWASLWLGHEWSPFSASGHPFILKKFVETELSF